MTLASRPPTSRFCPVHRRPGFPRISSPQTISILAIEGEPTYHLAPFPNPPKSPKLFSCADSIPSVLGPWCQLRAHIVHQQLLDGPAHTLDHFWLVYAPLQGHEVFEANPDLLGRLVPGEGLLRHMFLQDRRAADLLVEAARALGFQHEMPGVLGKRTKFQVEDLSQLVLLAQSRESEGEMCGANNIPEILELNDDTLLKRTEYTSWSTGTESFAGIEPSNQPARPLHFLRHMP